MRFIYTMSIFYEPGKNTKQTQTFDTRFQERDQSVVTNAHRLFPFMEVRKSHKQTPKAFFYGAPILQSTQKQVLNVLMTNVKGLR